MPNGDLIDRVVALGRVALAAPNVSYSGTPFTWYQNVTSVNVTPTNAGGTATSYAIQSGTLPDGVSLNSSTGAITGTPTALKTAANVVIRVTGPGGTNDATINVEVVESLLTSLVGYWQLDEESGTRADSHTNGLDLTDTNTVGSGLGVDGSSTAADFELDNIEYLSRASEAALQTGDIDFTLAAWVKMETKSTSYIASKAGGGSLEFRLLYEGGSDRLGFRVWNGAVSAQDSVDANNLGSPSTGTWYFVVAWRDKTASKVRIQVNNGTVDEVALSVTPVAGGGGFYLGLDGFFSSSPWDGMQQGFGYWKRVLTADERTWLYNSGSAARTYAEVSAYEG